MTYLSILLGGDLGLEEQLVDEAEEHEDVEADVRERRRQQRALLERAGERVVPRPVHLGNTSALRRELLQRKMKCLPQLYSDPARFRPLLGLFWP